MSIADALRVNSHLVQLDLSCNCIENEGAEAIAQALLDARKSALEELDLSRNYPIRRSGARAMAAMLRETCTLEKLDLGYASYFEQAGMEAIAEALRRNSTLVSLKMNCRKVWGDQGQFSVYKVLDENAAKRALSWHAAEHWVPRMQLPATAVPVVKRYLAPSKAVCGQI